jgi:hypothetical protein
MKPIPGYEGYLASEDGNVYSTKPFRRGAPPPKEPRKLSVHLCAGYRTVHLFNEGKRSMKKVSWCVLVACVGPRPAGFEICHGKAGKMDDSLGNLSWDTKKENNGPHKERDGQIKRGELHPNTRLTQLQVQEIRGLRGALSTAKTAKRFGVCSSTVHNIWHGKVWKEASHV